MKKIATILIALSALGPAQIMAQDLEIKVMNLTSGIHFTPLLVAAHDASSSLFMSGTKASASLQKMAEGGAIDDLASDMSVYGADVVENPAGGMLAPGASTTFSFMTNDSNNYLSLTAMLLPTNDGFVGADRIKIPTAAGIYTYDLNGYDAGTEANDEIINGGGAPGFAGIPKDPLARNGMNGTGVTTTEDNTMVHIHRGNLGDMDATGGKSDLDSTVHRWLNPVARMIITVK